MYEFVLYVLLINLEHSQRKYLRFPHVRVVVPLCKISMDYSFKNGLFSMRDKQQQLKIRSKIFM